MSMENLDEQLYDSELDDEYEKIRMADVQQKARLDYLSSKKENYDTEKPLKCDWCVDGFAYVSQINNHKRRHIGEKPFKCDFCDKTFSIKQSLPCHMKIYTTEIHSNVIFAIRHFLQNIICLVI